MERSAALPDRCVVCNADAAGGRLKRKFTYSPVAWTIGASLTPFLVVLAGAWFDLPYAAIAFWPLLVVLAIASLFVRKTLKLELGVCGRHRRLRVTLLSLSWLCVVAGVLAAFALTAYRLAGLVMLASFAALLVLGLAQSYVGVQAVRLKDLSADHAWLTGTGEPFRSSLPELH